MYFEGQGLVLFNIESPLSHVRYLLKDLVNFLKNFKIDNLEEIKKRTKADMIKLAVDRYPRFAAQSRAKEIFVGVQEGAILRAIDNVTETQLESAVERILSNISIGCVGNIDSVPYRDEIQSWAK
ncbi:hypothetical protein PMAYCL1PPCAC_20441 [Pristionchus mayeri]|uniref:Peptidase n=1 Tax=Pristionchus mayeri TaxID=1317129 RepID=A0AAN5CTA0_9BILA|nr:hypothetical protein PMAYCL1PPCAC_20441 [Pristionchus mayeri]